MKIHPLIFSVMLIICILFFTTRNVNTAYYEKHKQEIKKYQARIDSVSKINVLYLDSINELDTRICVLKQQIQDVTDKIETNKQQYDEKINTVNTFTDRELQEFFSKRYSNSINP